MSTIKIKGSFSLNVETSYEQDEDGMYIHHQTAKDKEIEHSIKYSVYSYIEELIAQSKTLPDNSICLDIINKLSVTIDSGIHEEEDSRPVSFNSFTGAIKEDSTFNYTNEVEFEILFKLAPNYEKNDDEFGLKNDIFSKDLILLLSEMLSDDFSIIEGTFTANIIKQSPKEFLTNNTENKLQSQRKVKQG